MRIASTASWRFPLAEINSRQPPSLPSASRQQLNLSQTIISRWMEQRKKKWRCDDYEIKLRILSRQRRRSLLAAVHFHEMKNFTIHSRASSHGSMSCAIIRKEKKNDCCFFLLHSRSCLAAARGMEPPRSIAWIQCEQSSGGDAMIANRVKLVFWSIYKRERKSSKTTTIFSERSQYLFFF